MFSTSTKIAFGYILLICLLFGAIGYIHQQMTLLTTPTGLEETIKPEENNAPDCNPTIRSRNYRTDITYRTP